LRVWVWFHPSYHHSEDISDLGDLYKQFHETPCQDNGPLSSKNELCYTGVAKEGLFEEIKSLEQKIYQDCFENFYLLIIEGQIELIDSHQGSIFRTPNRTRQFYTRQDVFQFIYRIIDNFGSPHDYWGLQLLYPKRYNQKTYCLKKQ